MNVPACYRQQSFLEMYLTAMIKISLQMKKQSKIMVSNIKSFAIKAAEANITTAKQDRIRCHRSSSRWSKKDISLGFLSI